MVLSKKTVLLACDFETTVYDGQENTEVWSAAYARLFSDKVVVHHSIEEFIRDLISYRVNIICWFHNEKFDGTFIVNYLLANGWEWTTEKRLKTNQFKTLISKQNRWYSMTLKTGNATIEIRDSVKIMPMSLKDVGNAFNTEHRKKDMEYTGYRYAGCKITQEEMEYIINDVLVLKEALEYMINEGHTELTIGSCAMKTFQTKLGKRECATLFPRLDEFAIPFEELSSINADDFIRHSYKGGWCYLRPDRSGNQYNGVTFDVNSLYPSMMHSISGNYYPIGSPHFWSGDLPDTLSIGNKIWFIMLRCRFTLKDNMLPTVQIKGSSYYKGNEWLTTSDIKYRGKYYSTVVNDEGIEEPIYATLYLTCIDYKLFLDHYNVEDLQIIGGCWFYSQIGLFDDYIDFWMDKKINATSKASRTEAKLFLNNLYGKFASNTDSSYQEPVLKYDGSVDFLLHEEFNKKPGYIAIGSMVTSYARNFTIRHAQLNYDSFIYADTDSLHMLNSNITGIEEHSSNLKCWKRESDWSSAIFIRQKTYAEFIRKEDGEKVKPYWDIKCAGMSERAKKKFLATHPINDFKPGLTIPKANLKPKRIPGGVVLYPDIYTIRK